MINSCSSSSSLIKLCVVFLLNISWFTTGTAPPLSKSQLKLQQPTTVIMPTVMATQPQKEVRTSTISANEWSTTIGNSNRDDSSRKSTESPSSRLSPTSSSTHVNPTAGRSLEIKPTFSTKPTLSSSLSTSKEDGREQQNLQGGTTSSFSLSKKFEDLLFSTPAGYSRVSSSSSKLDSKYKISNEISDIIGVTRSNDGSGSGGGGESESESSSDDKRTPSSSSTLASSTAGSTLSSSSSHSVLNYVGELSPMQSYSTSSSNFEQDGEQAQKEFLSTTTTSTSIPEIISSTEMEGFLPKASPTSRDTSTSSSSYTGSPVITTGLDFFPEDQMEYNDDNTDTEEEAEEGAFSIGVIFDRDYTPEEIAQYIFLTGDESGVASSINDLINDGLMLSREETIKFLEAVKAHLTDLRSRYQEFLMSSKQDDIARAASQSETLEEKENSEMSSETGESDTISTST